MRDRRGPTGRLLLSLATSLSVCIASVACGADSRDQPTALRPTGLGDGPAPLVDPVVDFRLSLENLRGLYLAHRRLSRLGERDPTPLSRLEEEMEEIPPQEMESITRAVMEEPEVLAALQAAGIAPADFVLTQLNLVNALVVVEARSTGRVDNLPRVSEQNVAFVERNRTIVQHVLSGRRTAFP